MLSLPFAVGLNIIKYILKIIYVCSFIVAISQIENFTISQMTFREISLLNRTAHLHAG